MSSYFFMLTAFYNDCTEIINDSGLFTWITINKVFVSLTCNLHVNETIKQVLLLSQLYDEILNHDKQSKVFNIKIWTG